MIFLRAVDIIMNKTDMSSALRELAFCWDRQTKIYGSELGNVLAGLWGERIGVKQGWRVGLRG